VVVVPRVLDSMDMSSRPISLLYVSDSPTVSGAEIVVLHYLDAFKPPAFRTHVFISHRNGRLLREVERRGVSYTCASTFARTPIRTTLNPFALADFGRALLETSRALARVIREHDVDIVHTTMYPASLYVAMASRMTGRPQIWHEHNIKRVHAVNRPIYRWVSRTCAYVIGPSDAVTAPLASSGIDPGKVRTLYNGINLAAFNREQVDRRAGRRDLGLEDGQHAVALFGQMLPHKGHVTLIDAAPAILRHSRDARFFFVGALENPPYEESLRARLREKGLEGRFVFTGWRQNVPALLAAMDVVVVPTLTAEPAALSLMEAMALERPLVASRTGGTAELVADGQTGLLFEPGDDLALARLVVKILADDALAARLGRAGRERMEVRFTLERHLSDVEGLYKQVTKHAHNGGPTPCHTR
jgi:glycosyltransferase involved in cell wall biosynthesis